MSATDISTIIAAYTGVAVVIGGIAWKLFRKAVKQAIEDEKSPISELRHNGGSSLLDVVKLQILPLTKEMREDIKELRENQVIISEDIARLEGRFQQHIDDGE